MASPAGSFPHKDVARNYLALSREFQELQLYRKAEDTLHVALEKLPDNPFLLSRLANFYLKLDMPEKALTTIHRLIRNHRNLGFPYFLRGKIHEEKQNTQRAIENYRQALMNTEKDLYVLDRLLPLMIANGYAGDALELIDRYQQQLKKPFLFAALEAEALLESGRKVAAFNRMRDALMQDPGDGDLLRKYLKLAEAGNKPPAEVYEILKMSVPGLQDIGEEDILDLELDYLIRKQQYADALVRMNEVHEKYPEDYFWRKKSAFLKLEMGFLKESVEEFRTLFLQNSTDREIRKVLENYFIVYDRINNWKQLIQQVLKRQPNSLELFTYLRSIGDTDNWLSICELDYAGYIRSVEELNLVQSDIHDVTYEKLPYYAFETFASQVAIHNQLPDTGTLWAMICDERALKQQLPPFQLEDLEAAYPVWVFALHIYFLFHSCSDFSTAFTPVTFLNEGVAATLYIDDLQIRVDITPLLRTEASRRKPLIQSGRMHYWRWHSKLEKPERMLHEIQFFTPKQFENVLKKLDRQLEGLKTPQDA